MLVKLGKFLWILFVLFVFVFVFGLGGVWVVINQFFLLVFDMLILFDLCVFVWFDSVQEEGLQIKVMIDSQFMVVGVLLLQYLGLILFDQVYMMVDDMFVIVIQNYVLNGGKVMFVYDFGVLNLVGFYVSLKLCFSSMVGVDYVLYD